VPIKPERMLSHMERFAAIGKTAGGGTDRLALSPQDHEARRLLVDLMREAGMTVQIDCLGNIWGRTDERWCEPAVVAGSHLDTVPAGGRFDGVAGVVAALEAVQALIEDGRVPRVPLGVACFAAEESSRFGVSTVGSKGAAGILDYSEIMAMKDRDGVTYLDALVAHGGPAAGQAPTVGCYLELHVEQGRELELAGVPLGVVQAIAAPTRYRVTVHGEAAHSGATLMTWRKDGLVAASELVLALERIAEVEEEYGTVATATIFALHPVSINVVPGRVELGVDIRGTEERSKRRAVERFLHTVRRVSAQRGVPIDLETLADEQPVALDPAAVACVRAGCERVGAPYMMMSSRAGHDAMNMARICPAAMLFVPSQGGVSHHPAEYTSPEHLVLGARALLEAMLEAAEMLRAGRGSAAARGQDEGGR